MGSYLTDKFWDQEVHTIHIPESTRLDGVATPEIVAEGAAFLHKDGIIILENAIDVVHIDVLNEKLSREALEIAADPDHHFNFGKETRNMDQAPPPSREYFFKDVWCNPFAAAILSAVLGPRPVIHYANGNTALKATARQPVHSDCEFAHSVYFPFAYVVNISLTDTGPENGATEVWPGSHHVSTPEAHVSADSCEHMLVIQQQHLEERRKHSPPVQARTKRGSLVIRDLRLWHAGMPNNTDAPRVMLAFVVQPAWFQACAKVTLPAEVRDLVESWSGEMQINANYVEGDVDHKKLSSDGVDFDTRSDVLEKYRAELSMRPGYVPRYY